MGFNSGFKGLTAHGADIEHPNCNMHLSVFTRGKITGFGRIVV
jgi:hypothetical protein